jgi:class 3 adenylate cyclase/tetratricopeptide (TPR) repeat protein
MAACPSCDGENRKGARFCDACGQPLAARPTAPAKEERKVVTVLFCDLVGFTAASESADPEDVRARLHPYHELLRERIEAFGGTVEKFVGDAVMAVFGAPVAHEDDAERAIRAGLGILERLEAGNEENPALSLAVRIGINTGEALVSLDARPEQGDGFVAGDVVNTASRIQSAAPTDGIAVGQGTFRAAERVFEWRELPAAGLKGKTAPVALWQPLAARARFGSDVIRHLSTPLVGRELDVLQLRTAFEKAAREPSVQLVTVVGEPGVGKSRLVAELGAHVDSLQELVRWRQGRCVPYGEGIAFWALGEIAKAEAGIYESDSPDDAARKLADVIPEVEEAAWLRARLLPLVGVDPGVEASRDESFTAWRRFLESIAEPNPAVLVFEDLHWADEGLLDFLEHLVDWAEGVPLLVICTARPELFERRPSWGAGPRNATTISLAPLSEVETSKLISLLLEQAVLPAETQQAILERAGGNPLYAEEFVRMLRDRDLLDLAGHLRRVADVPFPDSLQALIAARLDTVASDAKALLQDAAVVGKVFWAGAVATMGDRAPDAVEAILHDLARKELVRPSRQSSMEGEQELGFWHALVRDVAYGQIPRSQRADKHVAVAAWIEAKAGDRVEDMADVLAYHTTEAITLAEATGNPDLVAAVSPHASRYALLAGERALGLDAPRALQLLERAVELTAEEDETYPHVLLRFAVAAFQTGRTADAAEASEQAAVIYRARGDVVRTGEALTFYQFALPGVVETPSMSEAIALLESVPPGQELVEAYAQRSGLALVRGEYTDCILWSTRALELAEEVGLPTPARALGFHGAALANTGDRGALEEMETARKLLVERGLGRDAAIAHHNMAVNLWVFEGPGVALGVFEDVERFTEQRGLAEAGASSRAAALERLVDVGRLREALERCASLTLLEEAGVMNLPGVVELYAGAARAHAELGDSTAAALASARALARARELDHWLGFVVACGSASAAALRDGDPAVALALLTEAADRPDGAINEEFAGRLPELVRCALAAGDIALAERLAAGVGDVGLPLHDHASAAAQALLLEAHGEFRAAAELFAHAAASWDGFGATLEQAYALQGRGRCLVARGDRAADVPLREARAMFGEMGARPRMEECDALLQAAVAEGA